MKTLIVDDDAITRVHLNSTLTKLGHDVHEAADGHKALDKWHGGEFPFVILDWMMPVMDGLEICRRIREVDRLLYIILLSARGSKANLLEGLHAGADDYLVKPFDKDELRARVLVGLRVMALQTALSERVKELENGGRGFERIGLYFS